MSPTDSGAGPGGWRWERTPAGVPCFVPSGDLDCQVRVAFAAALRRVPPGSAPVVHIDLRSVAFLDAGTAGLIAAYRAEAGRAGQLVRILNATGLAHQVLSILDILPRATAAGPIPRPGVSLPRLRLRQSRREP